MTGGTDRAGSPAAHPALALGSLKLEEVSLKASAPNIVAWDTETFLMDRALVAPPMVCLQYADVTTDWAGRVLHARLAPDSEEALALLEQWLASDVVLVAHNLPYDAAVIVVHWPHLIDKVVDKFFRGQFHCTVIRQKLIDCALGLLKDEGNNRSYSLEAVAAHFKLLKDGADPWRLRYAELHDVPVELWPPEAHAYAAHDPEPVAEIWVRQEWCDMQWARMHGSSILYAGTSWGGECALRTETAWNLHLAQCGGFRTHKGRTEALRAKVTAQLERWRVELQGVGLVRSLTPAGRRTAVRRAPLAADDATIGDHLLAQYLTPEEWQQYQDPDPSRPKAVAKARLLRATADKPHVRKITDTGFELARSRAKAQGLKVKNVELWQMLSEKERFDYLSTDYDACVLSGDEQLVTLAEYGSADLLLGGIEDLAHGYQLPLQSGFDPLKTTGRTSSYKPKKGGVLKGKQLQNFGSDLGVRECVIPRPGNAFIQGDYPGAELHTHAQNCLELFGASALADMLLQGIDPHLQFGAKTLGLDYAFALEHKADPKIQDARGRAKPANFGFPGCMGAESFVVYSRAQWNTVFTLEEAVQIRADWLQAFPENEAYFQWVQACASDHGGAIQQFKSGRWRGGATYSAKCNGYFQGRCADGALAALRVVVRETLDPKKGSPLYGFRLVNFVHDELILEGPLDRCSEAAQRLADVMLSEFNEWVIDVPIKKVTPCVMLTWSKKAQTIWAPDGRTILPWDLQQVAA